MPGIYETLNYNLQGMVPTRLGSDPLSPADTEFVLYTVPAGQYARFVKVTITNTTGIAIRFTIRTNVILIDQEVNGFETFIFELGGLQAGESIACRSFINVGLAAIATGIVGTTDLDYHTFEECYLDAAEINQDYVLFGTTTDHRAIGFSIRNDDDSSNVNVRVGLTDTNTNGYTGPGGLTPVNQPGADLEDEDYIWYDLNLAPSEMRSLDEIINMGPNNLLTIRCDRAQVMAWAWGR